MYNLFYLNKIKPESDIGKLIVSGKRINSFDVFNKPSVESKLARYVYNHTGTFAIIRDPDYATELHCDLICRVGDDFYRGRNDSYHTGDVNISGFHRINVIKKTVEAIYISDEKGENETLYDIV